MRAAEQKLGVRALAEKAGIPHPTVSKSLNELRAIDVEELGRLSAALGVSPAKVMTDALALLRDEGIELADLLPGAGATVTPIDVRRRRKDGEDGLRAVAKKKGRDRGGDEGQG